MKLKGVLLVLFIFCSVVVSQTSIEQAFIDNEIVPDVLDKAPTKEIEVSFFFKYKQTNNIDSIFDGSWE